MLLASMAVAALGIRYVSSTGSRTEWAWPQKAEMTGSQQGQHPSPAAAGSVADVTALGQMEKAREQLPGGSQSLEENAAEFMLEDFGYSTVRRRFDKGSVPIFRQILDDQRYVRSWPCTVFALGYVAQGEEAEDIVMDYLGRDERWELLDRWMTVSLVVSKASAFQVLGMLHGPESQRMLQESLTKPEYVREFLGKWIGAPPPSYWEDGQDRIITLARAGAARGLVLTRDTESVQFLRQFSHQVFAKVADLRNGNGNQTNGTDADVALYPFLLEALAMYAFGEERVYQVLLELQTDIVEYGRSLVPYIQSVKLSYGLE